MRFGNSFQCRADAAGQLNSMLGGPSCGLKQARRAAAKLELHLQSPALSQKGEAVLAQGKTARIVGRAPATAATLGLCDIARTDGPTTDSKGMI